MMVKKGSDSIRLLLHGSIAAFGVYFSMYAFRKPFAVGTYEGFEIFHIDYKVAIIIAQVFGYTLSKFIGIKAISELKPDFRGKFLIGLVLIAQLALVLFAIVPPPYNAFFMILNGLPLGMIWGIVFSYLEGRRFTEILGVALCASFIVSSGAVKSVGLWTMVSLGVPEFWMPATTGAIFLIPLFLFTWLLDRLPPPTEEDKAMRVERNPMTAEERRKLLGQLGVPLALLVVFYIFLTIFRDFRDNFARELWDSIGYEGDPTVFTTSEVIISILVLIIMGSLFSVRDNFRALTLYHVLLFAGMAAVGVSTLLFEAGQLNPFLWMTISGFGLYLCYVPMNAVFFDRLIAAVRLKGNAGFLIYIADSFGYLGSVLILLYKNFGNHNLSWLEFFTRGAYAMVLIGFVLVLIAYLMERSRYFEDQASKRFAKP